jgi:hypothetical protein
MVSQQVRWHSQWLQLTGTAAWFRSDNYDSRLYQYEPSLLNDFSFPAYYGHGIHYAMIAKADIGTHLELAAKLGVTNYFDRSTIGTGLQEISRSSMADLLLQLNIKI